MIQLVETAPERTSAPETADTTDSMGTTGTASTAPGTVSTTGTASTTATASTAGTARSAGNRPVYGLTAIIGLFVVIVMGFVIAKPLTGQAYTATDAIIVGASALRALTLAMAWAAVRPWGRRVPGPILLGGLWGAAGCQILYPAAELVIKLLVIAGIAPETSLGATHTSWVSWFNLAMTVLIWGVPGLLLARIARDYRRRTRVHLIWALLGVPGGIAFVCLLGVLIG